MTLSGLGDCPDRVGGARVYAAGANGAASKSAKSSGMRWRKRRASGLVRICGHRVSRLYGRRFRCEAAGSHEAQSQYLLLHQFGLGTGSRPS